MRRLLVLSLLLASVPAAAAAQVPTTPPPGEPPPEQPAPPPPPPPPPATLTIKAEQLVLAGSKVRVTGRLSPGPAGQRVWVRTYAGGKRLRSKRVAVRADGTFRVRIGAGGPRRLTVRASHRATPEAGTAVAKPRKVDVLPRASRPGARGEGVRALQRRLKAMGYVPGRLGVYDARTARAVMAFRKVTGLRRTEVADRQAMRRMAAGAGRYKLKFPKHGKHVEADLSRQVLVLARGNRVERIYPTSSGASVTPTIRGSFRFERSEPGYNAKEMYYSRYFIRGYAIHGYKSVPPYPASHGCLRVPIPDAISIYKWIRLGDRIDVYR